MRWRYVLAAMLGAIACAVARAGEFPYTVYVNTADVYVRSGPGRDYYPTDKLQKGEKVEVYRHDPGGWYAIRPPRQSFSWVSSRHLDALRDGLARTNRERVVARVGSSFSDVRDVIQVRLEKGELVELLDSAPGESPWCKIAPPSGEFRWVFSKYVTREFPGDENDDENNRDRALTERRSDDAERVRLASGQADSPGGPNGAAPTDAAPRDSSALTHRRVFADEAARQRELNGLELVLSAMVVDDITTWNFEPLGRRAEVVLQEAESSAERGRARVLMDKLARFEDIRQRHAALRRGPAQAGVAAASGMRRPVDPRFDGAGRLAPVISQKSGGPTYALVDESNAVISFITPGPGVNLRPYVDKYVGVNGQRGYITDLQRQHISVQRVTLLDVQRR